MGELWNDKAKDTIRSSRKWLLQVKSMLNYMLLYKHSISCSFRFKLVVINDLLSKADSHVGMLAVSSQEFVGSYDLRACFQNVSEFFYHSRNWLPLIKKSSLI